MINKKNYISAWLTNSLQNQGFKKKPFATLVISDEFSSLKSCLKDLNLSSWRKRVEEEHFDSPVTVDGASGPVYLTLLQPEPSETNNSWPHLSGTSNWGMGRFKTGEAIRALEAFKIENLDVQILTENLEIVQGVICGLEISSYSYKGRSNQFKKVRISWNGKTLTHKDIEVPLNVGWSTNWARHLVNMPPNELSPEKYAKLIREAFQKKAHTKVEIWDEKKLAQENCGLHLAVGQGSDSPPRLVILKYRPTSAPAKQKPLALVGKGITFDTGGLDLKPPNGMRLMKKDMGGSAAVVGAFHFAVQQKLPIKLDAYLALAENSVSSKAFRPSDLVQARNGDVIEIHNTDAEGRLVLADALDVATTQKSGNQPDVVVDVATLTGAIKVALGSQIGGLFSNDDHLAQEIFSSFVRKGDDVWPMPLYQKYRVQMNSPFADRTNAVDGFGGAVTAALFLESFVNDVPWAHLDIYAWKDSPDGAFLEPGGSGQAVQGLAQWLIDRTKSFSKS